MKAWGELTTSKADTARDRERETRHRPTSQRIERREREIERSPKMLKT